MANIKYDSELKQISISLDKDTLTELKILSLRKDISLKDYIKDTLTRHVNNKKPSVAIVEENS